MLILYLSVFCSLTILPLDCYDYESNESYDDYSEEEELGEINKEPEDEAGPIHTSGMSHASEPLHAYIEMCKRKKTQQFHLDDGITSNSEEPEKHDIYRGFEITEMQSVVEEMSRTSCKPREVCLDVLEEYPFTTNTFYKPRCVAVHRCGGCCNAIHDNCFNISFSYVTKLLVKYTLPVTEELKIIKATFINHTDCFCKPKSDTRLSFRPRRGRTPVEENKRWQRIPC
ncbi:vascular endothelial growth factor C-like isoform X2 [Protopterus annectens]|uniref:vascular endothelial growth factor C-like isoform X2 n=1 Tax=Protopterus annectens TaxID=7888 RepID=UPI001CFBD99F|nr:vascular endothelial growth factor C-like isoform X2 [Protopterus annectens]